MVSFCKWTPADVLTISLKFLSWGAPTPAPRSDSSPWAPLGPPFDLIAHLGRTSGHLGRLSVLPVLEQIVELADEQILGAGQIVPGGHSQRQIRILQRVGDVLDDIILLDTYRQYLKS